MKGDDDEGWHAELFRWLAELQAHEVTVGRNRPNACNYMTVAQWIDEHPEDFEDCAPDELLRMKEANTIWEVQVYPTGSVSFYLTQAATLTRALCEMRDTLTKEYPNGFPKND